MKGLFPEYDDTSAADFETIWKRGTFIFDTNVLLNLYRYRIATRDQLLSVLEALSAQIWIPHHVALEFQRNRQIVIGDQNKRFTEVREVVEKTKKSLNNDLDKLQLKKRHSIINPDDFISSFDTLTTEFLVSLDSLQKDQQQITGTDPLKQKLETLFDGHVGSAPRTQSDVENLYKEADSRFKSKRPPGYKDADKDKEQPDEHFHAGITYKKKYGDFLVWKQILAHAKEADITSVIFVTDDGKEDWWLRVGHKTVGPRPELIDEARHSSGIDNFVMYSLESFLNYAKEFSDAQVSDEALKEVRDVSTASRSAIIGSSISRRMDAVELMGEYLRPSYDDVITMNFMPDILATKDGCEYGFEVVEVKGQPSRKKLEATLKSALIAFEYSTVTDKTFVILADNVADAEFLATQLLKIPEPERIAKDFYIMIITIDHSAPETSQLKITAEFPY